MILPAVRRGKDGSFLTAGGKEVVGAIQEVVGRRRDGTAFPLELAVSEVCVADHRFFAAIARDITQRKEAEKTLRESEERYRRFFEEDITGDFIATAGGTLLACNPAFARLFGFASVEEALRVNLAACFPDPDGWGRLVERVRQRGQLDAYQMELVRGDGRLINVVGNVLGRFDADGRLTEVRSYLFEITQQKRAQEALRPEKDFAESLIATAQAIVLVLDPEGRIVRFNPFLEEITGYRLEEVSGKDRFKVFLAQPDRACMTDLLREAAGGPPVRGVICPIRIRDGSAREVQWFATALKDARRGTVGFLLLGHDVTELNRAQERALQAERLAAIGQMVAGLAHESGNALQRTQAALERLARRVKDRPEALPIIAEIQQAQDNLHRLHAEVRAYAAPVKLEPRPWHRAGTWSEAWAQLAVRRQGRDAALSEDLGELEGTWVADPFRLTQVFRNILENSLAACPDRVRITVRTSAAEAEGRPAVRVVVRDNGPRLSPEQREKIFEPFYTTKTRGTGLGMAICKRIVEAHGGRIAVGGDGGPGAEIVLTLPWRKP